MRNSPHSVRNRGKEMKEAKELFLKNGFSRLKRTNNYYKVDHDFTQSSIFNENQMVVPIS